MFRIALLGAAVAQAARFNAGTGWPIMPGIEWNATGEDVMHLQMMPDAAATHGAVCLDGTPAGYYISTFGTPENRNDWQIYFQGGGWCYQEADCWGRSKTQLGSSHGWAPTSRLSGLLSPDCKINPTFCNFNRVHIVYCDGNSFSGNRDEPITVNGDKLYFRGRRILDAVIADLKQKHNFNNAENVLLTGCSAGGLSTFLHTDYVATLLPRTVRRYKSSPISGLFLLRNTVENKPVYPDQIKYIFGLANSTHGVNEDCIRMQAPENRWRCNFAEETYRHIRAPIFVLNSAFDSWSTMCILTSEPVPHNSTANGACGAVAGWGACAGNPEQCSDAQIGPVNEFGGYAERVLRASQTGNKPGNGGFLHSCHTHCEAQDDHAWSTYAINGVTMQQLHTQWWNAVPATPPEWRWPCMYNVGTKPRQCNPTCSR